MTALDTSAMDCIIGYRLRRAQVAIFQGFQRDFEALGLRPAEYSALVLIRDNPGRKQAEIALALGIKRANFVALADGLSGRGLLERRQREGDRRSNALFLTAAGLETVASADVIQSQLEARLVDALGGTAARDTMLGLLDRLTR